MSYDSHRNPEKYPAEPNPQKNKQFTIIKLANFIGKTAKEVHEYVKKEYPNRLPTAEDIDAFLKTEQNPKDWTWYYFFGGVYAVRDGSWGVPCVRWRGSAFDRDADWLGSGWGSRGRVVLLGNSLPVDSVPETLDFESLRIRVEKLEEFQKKVQKFLIL